MFKSVIYLILLFCGSVLSGYSSITGKNIRDYYSTDTLKSGIIRVENKNANVLVVGDEWEIKIPVGKGIDERLVDITEVGNEIRLLVHDGCSNIVYYDYDYNGNKRFQGYSSNNSPLKKGVYYFRLTYRDIESNRLSIMSGDIFLMDIN